MTDAVIRASARVKAGGGIPGTAYLVAPDRAVTCHHVVKHTSSGEQVQLSFPGVERSARVLDVDERDDWAVLQLEQPAGIAPLPVGPAPTRDGKWLGYGFPTSAYNGILFEGEIQAGDVPDPYQVSSFLVFSHQIAAGRGAKLPGASGTPVIIEGKVVGHLKTFNHDDPMAGYAQFGQAYGCPISRVRGLPEISRARVKLPPPGGAYAPDWHVAWTEEERQAADILSTPGAQTVVVWAPRDYGKSWFLDRCLHETGEGALAVKLNLDLLDPSAWSGTAGFVDELAKQIGERCDVSDVRLPSLQHRNPHLGLVRYMAYMLDRMQEKSVFLMLDGADEVYLWFANAAHILADEQGLADAPRRALVERAYRHAGDALSVLRHLLQQQNGAVWSRLRMLISVSTQSRAFHEARKSALLTDQQYLITLPPFDEAQIQALAVKHGLRWTTEDLRRLHRALGGHPYLSRVALYAVSRLGSALDDVINVEKSASTVFRPYVLTQRYMLGDDEPLREALRAVIRGDAVGDATAMRLEAAGLVSHRGGAYVLSCDLFRQLV